LVAAVTAVPADEAALEAKAAALVALVAAAVCDVKEEDALASDVREVKTA
jgi:hypothetical protein